ncbi:MAG: HK97 family phage prohead protease [Hyphomicrobiales bacterium]
MISQKTSRVGEYKFAQTDLARVEADGTFAGYASLFGAEDLGRDVIMPGAFKKSLEGQGAAGIRMLFQHDPNQPIGVWDIIREDTRGLYVKGRLTLDVERAREVHALMKEGGLNGLSIGFKTVKGKRDQRTGLRQLFEVDLWEISIVTFPMLPEAQVSSVKAVTANQPLPTTREFERWLMRDAGLSRKQAHTVIRSGFKSLNASRDAAARRSTTKSAKGVADTIRLAASKMCALKKPSRYKGNER